MKDYQIGQIITGTRANYVRPRIAALTLLSFAVAFGLARTGTTTITTGERPAVVCGVMGCSGNNPGHIKGGGHGSSGGGGTIHAGG